MNIEKEVAQLTNEQSALVLQNIPFAQRLAKQFYLERTFLGVEEQDYLGSALLGLCDAARRFDIRRGLNFQTFGYLRIRGAMYDLLRQGAGLPRKQFQLLVKGKRANLESDDRALVCSHIDDDCQSLPYSFAKNATELAGVVNAIEEIDIKLYVGSKKDSNDLSYAKESNPETLVMLSRTREYLINLIKQLSENEQKVIELRYFHGHTFDEMRKSFNGASKSWISRIHFQAVESLRRLVTEEAKLCDGRLERNAA